MRFALPQCDFRLAYYYGSCRHFRTGEREKGKKPVSATITRQTTTNRSVGHLNLLGAGDPSKRDIDSAIPQKAADYAIPRSRIQPNSNSLNYRFNKR